MAGSCIVHAIQSPQGRTQTLMYATADKAVSSLLQSFSNDDGLLRVVQPVLQALLPKEILYNDSFGIDKAIAGGYSDSNDEDHNSNVGGVNVISQETEGATDRQERRQSMVATIPASHYSVKKYA